LVLLVLLDLPVLAVPPDLLVLPVLPDRPRQSVKPNQQATKLIQLKTTKAPRHAPGRPAFWASDYFKSLCLI
jgi:hypothetical protein